MIPIYCTTEGVGRRPKPPLQPNPPIHPIPSKGTSSTSQGSKQGNLLFVFAPLCLNFCFIDYAKAFDCADHNKLWKILKEMGIPDHLTCLLRNLYAGQEATVRTGHETTDWFQIGKGTPSMGCHLWGHTESDTTEVTQHSILLERKV